MEKSKGTAEKKYTRAGKEFFARDDLAAKRGSQKWVGLGEGNRPIYTTRSTRSIAWGKGIEKGDRMGSERRKRALLGVRGRQSGTLSESDQEKKEAEKNDRPLLLAWEEKIEPALEKCPGRKFLNASNNKKSRVS